MRIWTLALAILSIFFDVNIAQEIQHLDQRTIQYQVKKSEPAKTENLISKCYDLAFSGLGKEAKELLIEAIYDSTDKNEEPYLRFALGQICYELKEYEGAKYQWNIVYSKFPRSEEAEAVKVLFSVLEWYLENWQLDQRFTQEYQLSKLFWSPITPDLRMNPEELVDPVLALDYLQELYLRYSDETKRAILLDDQFMLIMGYNANNLGYHHSTDDEDDRFGEASDDFYERIKSGEIKPLSLPEDYKNKLIQEHKPKEFYFGWAMAISDSLQNLSCGAPYYIKTQFLLGVSMCGSKIFSSKMKAKKEARPFFQNVINATEGEETNIYRLFAIKWLSETQ